MKKDFIQDETLLDHQGIGERPNLCYEYKGFYPPNPSGWTVSLETLKNLDEEGELEFANGKVYRKHRLKALVKRAIQSVV